MSPDSPGTENDANLSGLGRALLDTGGSGSKPSTNPWVPPTAEELGRLLPEYEIVKMLGRGGMGAVYMGRQKSLDRPVAIKILSTALEDADPSFAERFKNEARAMGKLMHPGIVAVFDFGETQGGLLYIVMEFVEGTDVSKMIAKEGRLHTDHAMAITAHVCDALAYAHERGIIHRDIKPANIMVGYDGAVKVADFGLAKMTHNLNTGLTQSGMAMGTLHYMAPEALMLGTAVDHRADIYAVGVMLYQMLTGKIPQGMFKLPSLQIGGLDPRYDGIISKAIMEDREARYQAIRSMRLDLDGILTQPVVKVEAEAAQAPAALPTMARPRRPDDRPYRPPQSSVPVPQLKHPSSSGWLVWVVLGVCALGGGYLWMARKPPSKEEPRNPFEVAEPAEPPLPPAAVLSGQSSSAIPTNALAYGTSRYAYFSGVLAWAVAKEKAEALGGHLATFNTQAEDASIEAQLRARLGSTPKSFWTGGVLDNRGGSWRWTTGEAFAHTRWGQNEPNNATASGERGALPFVIACHINQGANNGWHDFSASQAAWQKIITGYLVEWDNVQGVTQDAPPAVSQKHAAAPSASITKEAPLINTLGMKFVPVPGTNVLFCIHETRRQDYATHANEAPGVEGAWKNQRHNDIPCGHKDDHPVVGVSWEDAQKFCEWLGRKEGKTYRLATDAEWSIAVGLDSEQRSASTTPELLSRTQKTKFPWDGFFPPRTDDKVGNYLNGGLIANAASSAEQFLDNYEDGFPTTAPVMSFDPNKLGLYDMGGNAWEWCGDWFNAEQEQRVLRGGAWDCNDRNIMLSSFRNHQAPTRRYPTYGFRVVIELP